MYNTQPHTYDDTFVINVSFEIYLLYSVRVRVNVLYLMDACYRNKTITWGGWGDKNVTICEKKEKRQRQKERERRLWPNVPSEQGV